MTHAPIKHFAISTIQTVGVRTFVFMSIAFAVLAVTYLRVGAINPAGAQDLVSRSHQQHLLIERISKDSLAIEVAVRTDDWDQFEPLLSRLTNDHALFLQAHETFRKSGTNSVVNPDHRGLVRNHIDRLEMPYSQIVQALEEIEIITQSIIRRAPYIDQSSRTRIHAAVDSLLTQEAFYRAAIAQVSELSELNASTASNIAISRVRNALLLLLATISLTLLLGIVPRYRAFILHNKELRSEIEQSNESAGERWRLLASLGHHFRQPVEGIMGSADVLAKTQPDETTKEELAGSIINSGDGIMSLIDDVIDMASIETHDIQVQTAPTAPQKVLADLEPAFVSLAEKKDLEFRVSIDDSCPQSIDTDEHRLKQIISKAVTNAIEFTETGSVELHASLEKIEGREMFVLQIVDTGPGIESKDSTRIFKPFERVETASGLKRGGIGLGLPIARALTRLLGGDLTIKSAAGAGCFVTITIDPNNENQQQAHHRKAA